MLTEQVLDGGHQDHADDEGIHRHAHGESEGDRLDGSVPVGDEEGEDGEHDEAGGEHDLAGVHETFPDRPLRHPSRGRVRRS